MTQKILAAHAGLDSVEAGQLIEANLMKLSTFSTLPVSSKVKLSRVTSTTLAPYLLFTSRRLFFFSIPFAMLIISLRKFQHSELLKWHVRVQPLLKEEQTHLKRIFNCIKRNKVNYVQVWLSAPIIQSPQVTIPFSGRRACSIPILPRHRC